MDIQYYNKEMLGKLNRYLTKFGIFLIMAALIAGMVGCGPVHNLTISSTAGGSVTDPGEGTFTYEEGTVVPLVAEADEDYLFVNWTGDVSTIADVNAPSTNVTVYDSYSITANFYNPEIRDWYDLDDVRDNLAGNYTLMNDLDSTTAGYQELASPTSNGGKGWQSIGSSDYDFFNGTLYGQGYEIRNLFINRPDEHGVGLFVAVEQSGVIENIGVTNATVIGKSIVGGLVGGNEGTVSDSYSTGSVTGGRGVGGLVGTNAGTVSDSYSTGSVNGSDYLIGGLVGTNVGTVNNSYSTGNVIGYGYIGGLVGANAGIVSNSHSSSSVTGNLVVGGLVGWNDGTVSNSYYNYDEVLINGQDIITIGALFDKDFEEWLANDKFLDVNDRLSQENGYYLINDVSDFKELMAFGQDATLKFRLTNDLDLATEPNFYIPYLAGEFDGNGHKISNLSYEFEFVSDVGLFGYLAPGGKVMQVGLDNINITGYTYVGGLAGGNRGTVSNSYSTGSVTGVDWWVGGLVGMNSGTVSNSYSTNNVTGDEYVGGLVGENHGIVSNSYSAGSVTGDGNVGGLVGTSSDDQYVSNSFWDTKTSGQATSDGGTGKNTTEMKDITTFNDTETEGLDEPWNIIGVDNPDDRDTGYVWNIVDSTAYPFLSWQPV